MLSQEEKRAKFRFAYLSILISFWKLWYLKIHQGDVFLWDFRFSWRQVWRWMSSGLLRHVVWWKLTDVSEVLAASIIGWIISKLLPDYTAQQPRRQSSSGFPFLWSFLSSSFRRDVVSTKNTRSRIHSASDVLGTDLLFSFTNISISFLKLKNLLSTLPH
jgi:hypothetical protein